jgi:hypothetical protein
MVVGSCERDNEPLGSIKGGQVDKRCGRRFTEAWGKTMENESIE